MLTPLPLLLSTFCTPTKKALPPTRHPYTLVASRADKEGFSWVTLKATATGRAIWKRRVRNYDPSLLEWSKNHRALLVERPHEGFLVWRAGHPLLEIRYAFVPRPTGHDYYDYCMGRAWSPDAKRVLLSFGMSGMGDMGYSRMFCLTLKGTHYKYTILPHDCYVRDMGWRSSRVAFYNPAEGDGGQVTGKPRLWRVP